MKCCSSNELDTEFETTETEFEFEPIEPDRAGVVRSRLASSSDIRTASGSLPPELVSRNAEAGSPCVDAPRTVPVPPSDSYSKSYTIVLASASSSSLTSPLEKPLSLGYVRECDCDCVLFRALAIRAREVRYAERMSYISSGLDSRTLVNENNLFQPGVADFALC